MLNYIGGITMDIEKAKELSNQLKGTNEGRTTEILVGILEELKIVNENLATISAK